MKISWETVISVLIAMLLWTLLVNPLVNKVLPGGIMGESFEGEGEI